MKIAEKIWYWNQSKRNQSGSNLAKRGVLFQSNLTDSSSKGRVCKEEVKRSENRWMNKKTYKDIVDY
jgi:hypothetical protein